MISIIVPVYNVDSYLSSCLNSLLNQTYPDIEIICVDDGSTDRSREILKQYESKYEKIKVFTKPNGGPSSSRNFGIAKAKGDFVCFVDADDELLPESIERLYNGVKLGNVLAAVGSIEVRYDAHKELEESDRRYYKIRYSGTTRLDDRIISDFHYSACGCLFSMRLIQEIGLRFPEGLCFEDAWWHWAYFTQIKEY